MIIGSVLAKCSIVELSTADEKSYTLKNNFVTKLILRTIGIPHLSFRLRTKIILKEVFKHNLSSRILDAGCGYGICAMTLTQCGYNKINAVDIEQERVDAANRMLADLSALRSRITFHKAPLSNLPFNDAVYDIIVCSDVIEHIADDDSAIKELSRVLKPGGILVLSTTYNSRFQRKIFKIFGHERPGYTKEELSALFKKYGLSINKDDYYKYSLGKIMFKFLNYFNSKPLIGVFFYPVYFLYLVDYCLALGEPNGIVVTAQKTQIQN